MHPQSRDQRRQIRRIYDGDRHLTREMEEAYTRMRQLDLRALDSEWDHLTTFSVNGGLIATKAQDYLASLA